MFLAKGSGPRPMTIRWTIVQGLYSPEVEDHLPRGRALGLYYPLDVFEQLFCDLHVNAEFVTVARFVNRSTVEWEDTELSSVALRRVAVPRPY